MVWPTWWRGCEKEAEMQIEDGGDSPEVNKLLLGALRAGILHQVSEREAQAALRAIDAFEQARGQTLGAG